MKTLDFIPHSEPDQVIWLGNFQTNIVTQGPGVGVDPTTVTTMVASCSAIISDINNVELKKTALKEAVARKNQTVSTELAAIRATAGQIKTDSSYTQAVGQSLGIIGPISTFDPNTYKAVISVERFAQYARIKFTKKGTDGINIYRRAKGELIWHLVVRATKSPYDHHIVLTTEGKPEIWEYRAFGVINDEEIGLASDIIEIVFAG